jgi:sarcosine oxidase delta subunit
MSVRILTAISLPYLMLSLLSACSTLTPHENFVMIMRSDIGKNADDPSSYTSVYRNYRLSVRNLANGNIEEEYARGRNCRHFFEIEPSTRRIMNWRFEGQQNECGIAP